MLGLLLVFAPSAALALLLLLSPFGSEPRPARPGLVLAWTQSLRNDIADPFMVAVSQLSRLPGCWCPTVVATLLWLLGAKRVNGPRMHWLVAMAGGWLLQLLMNWTLRSMPAG